MVFGQPVEVFVFFGVRDRGIFFVLLDSQPSTCEAAAWSFARFFCSAISG
jgi:hypothetical protein